MTNTMQTHKLIDALYSLANARAEYAATANSVEKKYTAQDMFDAEVWSTVVLAGILTGDARAVEDWLPSWRQEEWTETYQELTGVDESAFDDREGYLCACGGNGVYPVSGCPKHDPVDA